MTPADRPNATHVRFHANGWAWPSTDYTECRDAMVGVWGFGPDHHLMTLAEFDQFWTQATAEHPTRWQ